MAYAAKAQVALQCCSRPLGSGPVRGQAHAGLLIRPLENNKPMPDTNTPIQRDDDEADATSVEARMRLALGKLGTKEVSGPGGPGGKAVFAQTGSQRRDRFARNSEVLVEHLPASGRTGSDAQRELAAERAARQGAEQALDDAKVSVARLQAALARSEQATRAARDIVEEREAAMVGLRAELQRVAAERDVMRAQRAEAAKQAKPKRVQVAPKLQEPQPVRWWLASTKLHG